MNILIAEDEADIRNLLKIHLEEHGHRTFPAEDGEKAWGIMEREEIHLALLDVMMPKIDGFNLLRKIRAVSTIPVIFLTARAEDMDKILGLRLGADDYLAKPFSMHELLARVDAHLRRSNEYVTGRQSAASSLRLGGLLVDKDGCCAYRDGKPLDLGAKEYKLLRFLMENPGRVFTKKQIYRAVWEDESYFDDNTVMVHISRLRSKIEMEPAKPRYIQTVRGIGYKLQDMGKT